MTPEGTLRKNKSERSPLSHKGITAETMYYFLSIFNILYQIEGMILSKCLINLLSQD